MTRLLSFFRGRAPAFKHAFSGLLHVLKSQRNAWIHASATVIVIIMGFLVRLSARDWAVIVFAIGLVWTAEILNTAIEAIVDLVSPHFNHQAKIAKDAAAAAVLIAALTAMVIGVLIFTPYFVVLFRPNP